MNMPVTSARWRIISPFPATGFITSIMFFSAPGMLRARSETDSAIVSERSASKRRYSSHTVS